jgi:hypothetical protein
MATKTAAQTMADLIKGGLLLSSRGVFYFIPDAMLKTFELAQAFQSDAAQVDLAYFKKDGEGHVDEKGAVFKGLTKVLEENGRFDGVDCAMLIESIGDDEEGDRLARAASSKKILFHYDGLVSADGQWPRILADMTKGGKPGMR